MRDPVLSESLQRLAAESAIRLHSLVATGDEIPFDVVEGPGSDTHFYRYVPLTARYVAEREAELRSLPSFEPAREAVRAADVATPYLETRGTTVPPDPAERAEKMLVSFIAALWDGCGEFILDQPRLDRAFAALDAEARDIAEAEMLVAPIVGLQIPLPRLQLPSGVCVVRADAVEAPLEAMSSEGMERAPWQPQFLALVEQGDGPEGTVAAMRQLRDLISVLRLFKEGGVGLGPYAFADMGQGKWRRLATGAPATRPGGYKLTEAEASELADFAARLEARPDPEGPLAWSIARFELGCERASALEGLSDHLLALRAVLEDGGPVGASLAVRASALIASPGDREDARTRIERAFRLERSLIRGSAPLEGEEDTGSGLALAVWIEDGLRAILRDGALAAGDPDIRLAADQLLIGAGLEAGEGSAEQRGDTAEWEALPEPEDPSAGILEPTPVEEDEIRVTAWTDIAVEEGSEPGDGEEPGQKQDPDPELDEADDAEEEDEMTEGDWLSEVSREATLEWPAAQGERRPRERPRIDTPRVRHLFQVPDNADWPVRELDYDRRRAGIS